LANFPALGKNYAAMAQERQSRFTASASPENACCVSTAQRSPSTSLMTGTTCHARLLNGLPFRQITFRSLLRRAYRPAITPCKILLLRDPVSFRHKRRYRGHFSSRAYAWRLPGSRYHTLLHLMPIPSWLTMIKCRHRHRSPM